MSSQTTRIVLIGAGSAQFGYDTLGDIFQSAPLRQRRAEVVLHDINPITLDAVLKTARDFVAQHDLPFSVSATASREDALQGADFCIISIEVGNRFDLWEQDWRIPQQFGVRQVYGENGGPGGFFHALRITPPILEICEDVTRICPEAVVFNYSNPMSRICTTVNRKFPDLNFIGLCHEIASLEKHLPTILDTPFENLEVRAGGLNHYSALLKATYKDSGKDAYPDILEKAPDYFATHEHALFAPHEREGTSGRSYVYTSPWHERGLFKMMLENYSLLPITTDSHLGEYPCWAWDVVDHEGILDFYISYKELVLTSKPRLEMTCSERVVPIMEGILDDLGFEEGAVNIPNKGFIPALPEFITVEVPAIIDKNGANGIAIGDIMPAGFAGLLQNQVAIHYLTAETVLTGSRDVALQALLADPIVDKVRSAEKMLDFMLELQKEYLGYIKR